MSNNLSVLLVGTGYMGREYEKVLTNLNVLYSVVGRSETNCEEFERETGKKAIAGGIDSFIKKCRGVDIPTHAIVAVGVLELASVTKTLLNAGVKNILVEKPGATSSDELAEIYSIAKKKDAQIYIGYNRRFYAATEKALEIIEEDKGVTSFHFEFTEWGHEIRTLNKSKEILDLWLYANSSHVCDLAFFLGGMPKEMSSYIGGKVDWHENGSIYTGAGLSKKGALFSYCANWAAPGRWAVEVLTLKHRLYLKPLEQLSIQSIGSLKTEIVDIDDNLDKLYKPGLYKEVESFIYNKDTTQKVTLEEQIVLFEFYKKMESYFVQ